MHLSRRPLIFAGLGLTLVLLAVLDLVLGSANIPLAEVWSALAQGEGEGMVLTIVREFRLPKMLTAVLVGISLSVSGLLMQTIFRNPLAGPFVLGISSGASLGAALALLSGWSLGIGAGVLTLAGSAWLGAMLTLFVILAAAIRLRSNSTILILGIMLSSAASAIVSILQFVSSERALKSFVIWSMGSLTAVRGESLLILLAAVTVGVLLAIICVRPLNLLSLGEHSAGNLGLRVGLSRTLIFISTSLLAGTVTAFCGPIGFIGVAVPHVARGLLRSSRQGLLLAGCVLVGASVMLLADIISALPGFPSSLPINAVAALMGLPVIFYLLLRKRHA